MADTCICRTDARGRRWTNAGCKKHGAHSAPDYAMNPEREIDHTIASLMGRSR